MRYLIISDLQIPFQHPKALQFCQYLQRHFKIPEENILNVGDEVDSLMASMWKKDPNGKHSAISEINESRDMLRPWYDAFPRMRLCNSNHGSRWMRKAMEAEIPEIMMRRYQDVLGCPPGWRWQERWLIKEKNPFLIEHGDKWGGQTPHIKAAEANGISTAIGHHHSLAGIHHLSTREFLEDGTSGYRVWGFVTGSLIQHDAFAFKYGKMNKKKAQIGAGVILDSGKIPMWLPLD